MLKGLLKIIVIAGGVALSLPAISFSICSCPYGMTGSVVEETCNYQGDSAGITYHPYSYEDWIYNISSGLYFDKLGEYGMPTGANTNINAWCNNETSGEGIDTLGSMRSLPGNTYLYEIMLETNVAVMWEGLGWTLEEPEEPVLLPGTTVYIVGITTQASADMNPGIWKEFTGGDLSFWFGVLVGCVILAGWKVGHSS